MKKVIPKKKNAFPNKYNPMTFIEIDSFNSIFLSPSVSGSLFYTMGIAKENIKAGDLVVFNENMKEAWFSDSKE